MDNDLSVSLLSRKSTKIKNKNRNSLPQKSESFRNTSPKKKNQSPIVQQVSYNSITQNELQWEYSSQQMSVQPKKHEQLHPSRHKYQNNWFGQQKQQIQKSLNHKVFNLKDSVQKKLYWFNMVMNVIMRIIFIMLVVYLALQNKRVYMITFLSLEMAAIMIYVIIMIKMLFTRSDKESVYFQKIFNQSDWADIQSERLMRRHFSLRKILRKVRTFFNPCTKFQKNTKISFLRQQIFKRMELVLVFIPFSVMFFINENDFVTKDYPNSKIYISGAICLEITRTTITYLAIYVYN